MGAKEWGQLAVAGLVLLGSLAAVYQKLKADNRDQWWKRTQWALDKVLTPAEEQASKVVGYAVLMALIESRMAGRDEKDMLFEITAIDLEEYEQMSQTESDATGTTSEGVG